MTPLIDFFMTPLQHERACSPMIYILFVYVHFVMLKEKLCLESIGEQGGVRGYKKLV